ncbi:polyadenylate-binding protein 2-like [Andrographis paniculata]|uniref:polyadenylate-binding protein 2-like n=1 Tax=Andrographis paniculata TaxID=175694 RepID=UPI0021E840B0|nr:polyadenylate-binding protein 2-like [Andrographis paniculata]
MAQNQSTSLYVGDLDGNVIESQIYHLFSQVGQVASVRICRDIGTLLSLGYGYVNFNHPQDAARAIEELNFTPLNNQPIRIMYSRRDPSIRRSGTGNIFIKNLDKGIDNKALRDTFSSFGTILSCKVATYSNGQSKGHGFVQFHTQEAAQSAIDRLNGMLINDKQVYVGHFHRKQERETAINETKFNNVYVKNLSESTTDDDLKRIFGEYGKVTSGVVMRDGGGKSKCFGFINFEIADDAAKAVEALNGKKFDEKEWYVRKALKKPEREQELQNQTAREAGNKVQGTNLYVKNLDDKIDDEKLKELFAGFGTITSCKVMLGPTGVSKGCGFVRFSTSAEAARALAQMNGRMVIRKPLYVAVAERKKDRTARLQAQFSQRRAVPTMLPPVGPRMPPIYPPVAAAMGQQLYFGQGPPAIVPPQAGYGYQPHLAPGMCPGGAPIHNFFVPVVPPGQQGQRPRPRPRPAGRCGQQNQQPVPMAMMLPQTVPQGRMYGYPPGAMAPAASEMRSVPFDVGTMLPQDAVVAPKPVSISTALASAQPEYKRRILGEYLYPLVDQLEHDHAAKITGMLLEMDQTEVLHLLESPEALKAKVAEAGDLLRNAPPLAPGNSSANQLAS